MKIVLGLLVFFAGSNAFAAEIFCVSNYALNRDKIITTEHRFDIGQLAQECATGGGVVKNLNGSPLLFTVNYFDSCRKNGAVETLSVEVAIPGHSGADRFDYFDAYGRDGKAAPSRSESMNFNTTYKGKKHHVIIHCELRE